MKRPEKKDQKLRGRDQRRDHEWFERTARGLWSLRWQAPASFSGPDALARLLEADDRLRYKIAPTEAVAYVKALFGTKERVFSRDDRLYLRRLAAAALPEIRKKALPPKPSGIQYTLTIHEERWLTRAYRGLVNFFEAPRESAPTLEKVNERIACFYPPSSYPYATLTDEQLLGVLTHRTSRQRAMAVLVIILPLGKKTIEQRCYAIDRSNRAVRRRVR